MRKLLVLVFCLPILVGCLNSTQEFEFEPVDLSSIEPNLLNSLRGGIPLSGAEPTTADLHIFLRLESDNEFYLYFWQESELAWGDRQKINFYSNSVGDGYSIGNIPESNQYFAYKIEGDIFHLVSVNLDLDQLEEPIGQKAMVSILAQLARGQDVVVQGETYPSLQLDFVESPATGLNNEPPRDGDLLQEQEQEQENIVLEELQRLADEEIRRTQEELCEAAVRLCNRGCVQRDDDSWIYNTSDGLNWYDSRGRLIGSDDEPDFSCPIR
jgi:hypothetical protein